MPDGIAFDKTSYKPGDKATITVTLAARTKSDTFDYTTAVGNLSATTTVVADGTLAHTLPQNIVKVSDNGTVAVYTVQY